jgi:xylulokinase
MADPILLTIDLGTTNCKAVAFTLDGEPCVSASAPYPTLNPREGWYEQRVADWQSVIAAVLQSVSQRLGSRMEDVAGLCLSAWGPGLVLLDADGAPLNQASPTWQDVRSIDHGRMLVREAGTDWVGGGLPLTGFPAKLAWAAEAWPDLSRRAAYAIGVKDYILFWLTGSLCTDPSSGPYSVGWPTAVFSFIGWDVAHLPPVAPSTDIVGRVRRELAEQFGLPPELPVISGLNDGAAATLGVGAHHAGDAVVSLGTNGVLRLVTTRSITAEVCLERSLFRYPLVEGLWACGGFVLAGGSALSWFADAIATPGDASEIDDLLRDAGEAPAGSDGVVFLPYLVGKGSPQPDPGASATFTGLRFRHRRSHLTRAVLEGVAFGMKDIAEALVSLNLPMKRLFITGGGAASSLWRGIVVDVLGLPASYTQGDSNLGAAIVLVVGLGIEPNIDAAVRRLVSEPATTPTTRENLSAYEAAYQTFRASVAKLTG